MKKETVIPIQPDRRTHLFWFIDVQDLFMLLPFGVLAVGFYKGLGLFIDDSYYQLGLSVIPLLFWGALIVYNPIRHRKNIRPQQFLYDMYDFNKREKTFEFKKDVENVNKRKVQKGSTQSILPFKKIAFECYETKDNRLVAGVKIGTINLSLENDENETKILENYEKRMLVNLDFNIQQQIIAEKIDLREHRNRQITELELIDHPIRHRLKRSYIDYVKAKEENRNLVKKQRYIFVSESFDPQKAGSKEQAREELKTKIMRIESLVQDIPIKSKLRTVRCTNEDLKHSIRLFMDYEYSFIDNSVSDDFSEFVVGRRSFREDLKEVRRENEL